MSPSTEAGGTLFALQDEPERGRRWLALLVGALVASGVWGGGIAAADRYQPPRRPKPVTARMQLIAVRPPPPPKAPEPKVAVAEPKPEVKQPKPKQRKPKKRKPRRAKKKVAKAPEPPKPVPSASKPRASERQPPRPAPVVIGLALASTSARGRGPAVQVGNHFGGSGAGKARPPETREAQGRVQREAATARTTASVRKKVRPTYTEEALRRGLAGKVVIVVTIEPDGRVSKTRLIKGLGGGLDREALAAVRRWVFSPATVGGVATRSTKRISVDFVIER